MGNIWGGRMKVRWVEEACVMQRIVMLGAAC